MGLLGNLFDLNGDGKLDAMEQAAEFSFLEHMLEEDTVQEEVEDALEEAGFTLEELQFMDADERREALEEAGLDPDEFEDDF